MKRVRLVEVHDRNGFLEGFAAKVDGTSGWGFFTWVFAQEKGEEFLYGTFFGHIVEEPNQEAVRVKLEELLVLLGK